MIKLLLIFLFLPVFIASVAFAQDSTAALDTSIVACYDSLANNAVLDSASGIASYYSTRHHGRKTACGKIFNMHELTASHNMYPFGTIVRIINPSNNLSVIVEITDRLSRKNKRLIDLSYKAAQLLGMIKRGVIKVKIEVLKWGEQGKSSKEKV